MAARLLSEVRVIDVMRRSFFIHAAGLLLATEGYGSPELRDFESMDANKDGRLSKSELPIKLQALFEKVDRDGDGFVSPQEDRLVRERWKRRAEQSASRGVETRKDLDYVGEENPRQMLDLYLPTSAGKEPLPVVCWIHGGGWRQGSKNQARRLESLVASGRFAGVSIGYRLTDEASWPAQIHDCKAAIRWVHAHADEFGLNADRIAVWGASAGGHLVAMLGVSEGDEILEGKLGIHLDESADVTCVVNFFGPSELLVMDEQGSVMNHSRANSPEGLLVGGAIEDHADVAKNASPVHHVAKGASPMLLVHGTADKLVPYKQSVKLSKALENVGTRAPLITVKGGGHGQGFGASVDAAVLEFLGQQLLGEPGQVQSRELAVGE